ncbi:MAG: hypothetical protein QOD60_2454, partial [Solirubrobacterales bacterium]|nr:hypothetical protein [Solirubrobacterales bacterium]
MRKRRTAAGVGLSIGAAFALPAAAHADFQVDTTSNDGGVTFRPCTASPDDCSLPGALTDAAINVGPDNITFAPTVTGSITLGGSELPLITGPTFIYGPGADVLAIDGNHTSRIFDINETTAGDRVVINGLTIRNGTVTGGLDGGAIRNEDADLSIFDSVLSGNSANTAGGNGGALYDKGGSPSLGDDNLIINSTISGNTAANKGGGLYGFESLGGIYGTTVSGNTAGIGGGVEAYWTAFIEGSTIAGNTATAIAGGGGLHSGGPTGSGPEILNTIVAGNSAPSSPDVSINPSKSLTASFSLIQSTAGATINSTGPNIFGVSPQLGPLQNNGGHVQTMKPAGLSPVVDKGLSAFTADARGLPRVFDVPAVANAAGGNG